jgi:RimJ/RimL family protein N-acetyltransferase
LPFNAPGFVLMFLRPLDTDTDAPALHEIFGDPDCCLWLPQPAFADVAATREKLRLWSGGRSLSWVVVCATHDGPALGRISLYAIGHDPDIWETACMIAPSARGHAYAARALSVVINRLFDTDPAARRVFADIDPDNAASIRTFEKLGFTREAHLRGTWKTHIGVRDSVIFGLLRDDPRPAIGPAPVFTDQSQNKT